MTYKETHAYLENLQRELTNHRKAYANDLITANGKAIEAVEMQIPKKPKIIETSERSMLQELVCPKCHAFFGERVKGCGILFHTPIYCERCGQKIDWGDE